WTRRILLEDAELSNVLAEGGADFADELVQILAKTGGSTIVRQLITSQLDVDRMDYLLRDALNTGVSYGRFELARLIRSLTIVDEQVVLKESGLHTVEQYILARYFMYTQVYLHPVTVGSDVLVMQILKRAGELWHAGQLSEMPSELVALLSGDAAQVPVQDYLAIDESTLVYAFHRWSRVPDAILSDLANRFLHRRLFWPVVRPEPTAEEWAALRTSARALGFHPDYYVSGRASEISGYVYRGEGIPVLRSDGRLSELSRESRIVRALVPDSEYRLFLPREMVEGEGSIFERVRSIVLAAHPGEA
ncbi:MAG: HD domain-containing protein, partial [Alicyclobacillus sp.]|nr:HD domain-containing protein [Alicyclobacillus sp.]